MMLPFIPYSLLLWPVSVYELDSTGMTVIRTNKAVENVIFLAEKKIGKHAETVFVTHEIRILHFVYCII